MRCLAVVVLLALATGGAACQRLGREDCEALCWRYMELEYWDQFEAAAKDLAPEDRKTLEAERKAQWEATRAEPTNRGRDNCVTSCRHSGTAEQARCVGAATTVADARACMAED